MTSFVAGVLGLIALDTFVSSKAAAGNTSKFVRIVTGALRWVVDPAVPGIPNRTAKKKTTTTTKAVAA